MVGRSHTDLIDEKQQRKVPTGSSGSSSSSSSSSNKDKF